jgi:hypothetical protein
MPYLNTQFNELNGRFSPDGKWMAYDSDESGQTQVFVQAVPPNGSKWQISNAGGYQPAWRRDGKELFYISTGDKLMAAPVKLGSTVAPGTPDPLFDVAPFKQVTVGVSYGVSRDGQRFLISVPAGASAAAGARPRLTLLPTGRSPSTSRQTKTAHASACSMQMTESRLRLSSLQLVRALDTSDCSVSYAANLLHRFFLVTQLKYDFIPSSGSNRSFQAGK